MILIKQNYILKVFLIYMIYSIIKIKFLVFNKIIKVLNFIKLNEKQIKISKEDNGKIKFE